MANHLKRKLNFRWVVVFLLFFITVINYIDRSAISFTFNELNISKSEIGLILGGFGIGYLITTFIGGILVDHFRPRKILAIAVVFWVVSMFTTAIASSFALLFASRILLGLAEGPNFSAMTRACADWLPPDERIRSLSYGLMSVPIALAIGAPIITELTIHFSWRGMFVILGVFALIWIPIWLMFFNNDPKDSKYVTSEELAKINEQTTSAIMELTQKPITWRYMLTNLTLLSNYWAFFVFGYFLFFFMGWLPNYLHTVYKTRRFIYDSTMGIRGFIYVGSELLLRFYNEKNQ